MNIETSNTCSAYPHNPIDLSIYSHRYTHTYMCTCTYTNTICKYVTQINMHMLNTYILFDNESRDFQYFPYL